MFSQLRKRERCPGSNLSAESEANGEVRQCSHFDVWKFSKCGSSRLSLNHLTLESTASAPFLLPLSFVTIRVGLEETLRFNELVRLLEQNGFRLIREKGSVRYYAKAGVGQTDSG